MCVVAASACDDSAGDSDGDGDSTVSTPEGQAPGDADQPSENAQRAGLGSAVLTVGDQTWEFDNVQCAVGTDETNSTDWDLSMIASLEGLQLNVDRSAPEGRFGDSISLVGTDDPTTPFVAWEAPAADLAGGTPIQSSFVMVDGQDVSADTTFWNDLDDDGGDPVPGSLIARCP